MTQSITIRSTDGLALEAELDEPEESVGVVVMCHPHPRMGGTMNAPLLLALRTALVDSGRAVLRFNFRGIGASEGESSTGTPETNDAAGAVASARERFEALPVGLVGWSFGGAVAVRTAARVGSVAACVGIAPSIEATANVSEGLPTPAELDLSIPLLFVCGRNDEILSPEACRSWAEAASARHHEIAGANHFFWGRYDELCDVIVSFFEETMG
ncbi:MAG: alpha/beta hydrolase [Actinomycetota bacterium]